MMSPASLERVSVSPVHARVGNHVVRGLMMALSGSCGAPSPTIILNNNILR